jgi:hypothetical protein
MRWRNGIRRQLLLREVAHELVDDRRPLPADVVEVVAGHRGTDLARASAR